MSEEVGRGILGEVTAIDQVVESGWSRRKSRHIIFLMSASVSLLMTGFGIIMPIFGRKLAEMGLGVESLGMMIMAFSIAQFVAAPLMGKMADRYGRRRLVLLALFSFGVANLAFLLADSLVLFVAIRAVQGFFTAGLLPACIGIIGDLDSGDGRAKKIGWLVAGHSVGFVFGPFLGGLWYDLWGFEIPFLISAALGFISLVFTYFMIPETLGVRLHYYDVDGGENSK